MEGAGIIDMNGLYTRYSTHNDRPVFRKMVDRDPERDRRAARAGSALPPAAAFHPLGNHRDIVVVAWCDSAPGGGGGGGGGSGGGGRQGRGRGGGGGGQGRSRGQWCFIVGHEFPRQLVTGRAWYVSGHSPADSLPVGGWELAPNNLARLPLPVVTRVADPVGGE